MISATRKLAGLGAAALLLAGCVAGKGYWWNPLTWSADRAGQVAEAQSDEQAQSTRVLKAAQAETQVAVLALASADPSRPVDVAKGAVDASASLQAQALGPLSEQERQRLEKLVADLLGENEKLRQAAEAQRARDQQSSAHLAKELEESHAEVARLQGKLAEGYAKERATAMKWRNMVFVSGGAAVLGLIGTGLFAYLRITTGGTLKAVVSGIEAWKLKAKGTPVEPSVLDLKDVLRGKLDTGDKLLIDRIKVGL